MFIKTIQCVDCNELFIKELFKNVRTSTRCDDCRLLRDKLNKIEDRDIKKQRMKAWRVKNIHGITIEQINKRLDDQNNECKICFEDITDKYVIDHDHNCCPVPPGGNGNVRRCGQCIRGLLCSPCNSVLGYARDDVNILSSAIEYLKNSQL